VVTKPIELIDGAKLEAMVRGDQRRGGGAGRLPTVLKPHGAAQGPGEWRAVLWLQHVPQCRSVRKA
jgi:hypothetical protein